MRAKCQVNFLEETEGEWGHWDKSGTVPRPLTLNLLCGLLSGTTPSCPQISLILLSWGVCSLAPHHCSPLKSF